MHVYICVEDKFTATPGSYSVIIQSTGSNNHSEEQYEPARSLFMPGNEAQGRQELICNGTVSLWSK